MSRGLTCLAMVALLLCAACGANGEKDAAPNSANPNAKSAEGDAASGNPQGKSLDEEMARLKVSLVLILPSGQIAQNPVWSPESEQIAAMVGRVWFKVNLKQLVLNEAEWRGQKIGQIQVKESAAMTSTREVNNWRRALGDVPQPQQVVTTKQGVKLELRKEAANTSLIATGIGRKSRTLWSVNEDCRNLLLSPDEKYVAFLAVTSGILVMKLADV